MSGGKERGAMDRVLKCKDMGFVCNFVICGETEVEVVKKGGEHLEFMHYTEGLPRPLYRKALMRIHEGDCGKEIGDPCPGGICVV
ncbi:MAG: DUF1059 domain-containing protein [Deltaproteobacteria bacterium]|nr:MAG: DUF1059 domain-containing protein [Deltaproteobacteria bacterium]